MATNQKNQKNEGNSKSNSSGNTSARGFASMDDEKQREIASKGGKASHSGGNHSGGKH